MLDKYVKVMAMCGMHGHIACFGVRKPPRTPYPPQTCNTPLFMADLPPLPLCSDENDSWSPNVQNAYTIMADMHRHALNALRQELDAPRARIHVETLSQQAIPILLALENSAEDEGLPHSWLQDCAVAMGSLMASLQKAEVTADGM